MLLGILTSPLEAQSEWEHFITRGESLDVEIYNNTAYVANRAGLLTINLDTHEETLIHPGNHTVPVQGFREIEILDNGHMWLSSAQEGYLYYYDGETFTLHCDSISTITNLVLANDRLWFMSGSLIDYPTLHQANLFSLTGDQCIDHGDLNIFSLTTDQNDDFWFATSESIKQFDGENIIDSILLPNQIYSVSDHFIDSENKHWLSTDLSVPFLFVYEEDHWITSFTNHFVEDFYEFEPGNISALFIDNRYVEFVDYQAQEVALSLPLPDDSDVLLWESMESVWYKTEKMFHTSRLFWSTPDTILEFGAGEDFIQSTIVDLTQDCDGNLVSSNRLFVQKYIDEEWQSIPLTSNNEDCHLGRFIKDPFHCEPWLGGSSGNTCLSIWELSEDSLIEAEILPQYRLVLYRDQIGNIYFTTPSPAEIHKIDPTGVYTTFFVPGSIAVLDIRFLSSGQMILTSFDDAPSQARSIRILEDEIWSQLDLNSLGINELKLGSQIHQDSEGNLWFHESNGLIKYAGEDLSYFPIGVEVAHTQRNNLVEDGNGDFWISTSRDGILRWNPNNSTLFTTSNSDLLSNACRELQVIDDELWVNHYYGLTKIKIDEINSTVNRPDISALKYTLFPNPSSGQITLTNPLLAKRTIDIFTTSGVLLSSHISTDATWSTTLEAGVYWVKLRQPSGEAVEKVVIHE